MANEKLLLKDQLVNENIVRIFFYNIKRIHNDLDVEHCVSEVIQNIPQLELKERLSLVRNVLEDNLPKDFIVATKILSDSSKYIIEGRFIYAVYSEFVEKNGCNQENLDLSLELLGEYTKLCTSEFAIRDFLNHFPKQTLKKAIEWSFSKDVHIRRLASEGLRPKLPWAKGITLDYKDGCKPLENLYFDSDRYVTRSVANHLNDISKIDPLFVLKLLDKWRNSQKQTKEEMTYIINHSLRTLVKKGHKETLEFLGHNSNPKIEVSKINISNTNLFMNDYLQFDFEITSKSNNNLVVDYIIDYPMANKKRSLKVFKIKKIKMSNGEKIVIFKRMQFKPMTTKKLYSGDYILTIQINGKVYSSKGFTLSI